MSFRARRFLTTLLIVSLFIQMQIAANGYAFRRAKIAFTSTRDGNSEIYVMDSDGSDHVRLTYDPAIDSDPALSPDGRRIAFVSRRNGRVDGIYVMDSDGEKLMQLTKDSNCSDPAWSPDGKKIAFTRSKEGRQVWVMDADGQNQTRLTHAGQNFHPAWSPDGRRIAITSSRLGGGIVVMDENGNNQERLTRGVLSHDNPSWSPDGQWIVHDFWHKGATHQISVVRTDGSGLSRRLTRKGPHKRYPAWSPDGKTIAYVQEAPNRKMTIHLMTADGRHIEQLSEEHDGSDTDPDWFDPAAWSVSPAANVVTMWGKIKQPTLDLR